MLWQGPMLLRMLVRAKHKITEVHTGACCITAPDHMYVTWKFDMATRAISWSLAAHYHCDSITPHQHCVHISPNKSCAEARPLHDSLH